MTIMKALFARNARRVQDREDLRRRVREALPEMVRILVEEFGARKVVLFGSMLRGFDDDHPDVDLLVEGLSPERRAEVVGRLWLLAPVPVDLVRAESARVAVVRRALEEGEVLHGA